MNAKRLLERLPRVLAEWLTVAGMLAVPPVEAATTLSLAHIYVAEHPTARACQVFADTVKAHSQGRLQVKLYDEASIGNQTAILQSLTNGSLDLAVLSQGSLSAVVPEFNALGLPYLFPDPAAALRVLEGSIGQQLTDKLAAKGIVLLGLQDVEIRQLSNSVRPVLKPADLAGLKIRVPPDPLAGEVISALGGKPQEINFSDIYKALQYGVVDGQENPLFNVRMYRYYDFQKFISLTGHKYSIYFLLMRKKAWDSLTSSDREAIGIAAQEAGRQQRKLTRNVETEAYRDLLARGVRIDKVDTGPFVAATAKIYDKWYAGPNGDFVRAVVQAARGQ